MSEIIMSILSLLCGLALFLFGMDYMGDSLKKSAGSGLKKTLGKMTSSQTKGFILGLGVTAIIQSSSATTVMVVGFVNSGTMTLTQAIGVIMGANLGTAVTAWITGLSGIGGAGDFLGIIQWLKPDAWMPILAVIGICLIMFTKRGKKRDIGGVLIGFAVLMVGMNLMSDAVGAFKDNEGFKQVLTMFSNPILGMLAGLVLTVIVQSSSASIGILQSLTTTGTITFGMAIPIIMGQNIGTCITALISSIGATKNGKRAAFIHLYFNVIGAAVWLAVFMILNAVLELPLVNSTIDMFGVAGVHTVFKLLSIAIIAPFYRYLEKLALITIRDKEEDDEKTNLLDERLFTSPSVAASRATDVAYAMAELSCDSLRKSLTLFEEYDVKIADEIRDIESKVDNYEDALGSYLVKLSGVNMDKNDSTQITKLLHIIGDLERISDHAVNIVESVEEMRDKKISFSEEAKCELATMRTALINIVNVAEDAFKRGDISLAFEVEPIEEVIDDLRDAIKANHIERLKNSRCTIEHGFVLSDILTNFERVSDHCSNIGECVIEISKHEALDMHKYIEHIKEEDKLFEQRYEYYKELYKLA